MNALTIPTTPQASWSAIDAQPVTRGHIGRIVTLTMIGGLLGAVAAAAGPFAGVSSVRTRTPVHAQKRSHEDHHRAAGRVSIRVGVGRCRPSR